MHSSKMQQSLAQLILKWRNISLQEIDEVSRADLSVEVDTESLQVDVPQQ